MENVLEYTSTWYVEAYTIHGHLVDYLTEVAIAGTQYKVTPRVKSVPYGDHGHTYYNDSVHYYIEMPVGEKFVNVDLNKIVNKQKVLATKFKLKT